MRAGKRIKSALATALALALLTASPVSAVSDSAATDRESAAASARIYSGESYNLSENAAITISSNGSYAITGSAADGCITVDSGVTATLTLSDVTLASVTAGYAPIICKKNSNVTLIIDGAVTLTDNEDASDANSEGAAIKVKSGASLIIQGDGTLNVYGICKNGVKGAATSSVTVKDGVTLNIQSANHGLAADGAVIVKGGTLDITAANDGIKSSPDDGDTDSAGTVTVYDGDITISAQSDGINAAGDITIYGGAFAISAQSDGVQTDSNLTISDGTFNITTLNGYNSGSAFDSDTMSCKGLKASASDDDTDDATNTITITGGTFVLNTADDAIHSDAYIEITGGKFTINTGDDGAHADTSLILGTNGGTVARDPDMTINNSYEGLEAGTVYIYSGRYRVRASDDGINAAGGSSGGSDPGNGGGNHFNPGGGGPGGRMMGAGGRVTGGFDAPRLLATSDYSLNIMGGNVYVNADGDGLDSNGALTLTGGNIEVWGQSSGDNEPLDSDGALTVNGATVFAAGCAGMGVASPSNGSQGYTSYGGTSGGFGGGFGGWGGGSSSASSISSGALISVTNGSSTVYQANAPKAVSYVFFSSPNATSSYSISSGGGTASCQYGNDWTHTWNSGVVTTAATQSAPGVRTYTCSVCNATETETIPQLVTIPADSDDGDDTETDTGYAITFVTNNCSVNVYHTHDYTTPDESGVTSTVSYNSDTGKPDSSGDGQINFTVIPSDGYSVGEENISVSGSYKNLKGPDDTGLANTWRITKITSDLTISVSATQSGSGGASGNTCAVSGTNAAISLDLSGNDLSAGTYCLITGFYASDSQLLGADSVTVTLDNTLSAKVSVSCPSSFDACAAFLLDSSDYAPVCPKTELTIVS